MAQKKLLEELNLEELEKLAKAEAKASNDGFDSGKFKDALDAGNRLKKVIARYAEVKREEVYLELKKTDDPMLEAIKMLTYPTIVAKEYVPEGEVYKKVAIETADRAIDLIALDKFCGGTTGKNKDWIDCVKFLASIVAMKHAKQLGDNATIEELKKTKAYGTLSEDLKKKILGGKTPNSAMTEGVTATLNAIIEIMVGKEYATATKVYAEFLLAGSYKKGREKLTMNMVSNKLFTGLLAEIIHGVIKGITPRLAHKIK